MRPSIITEIKSFDQFIDIISINTTAITIIKLSAKWCQPCKRIEPLVYQWADKMPDNVQICCIDIDVSIELYSFLKKKRIVNGIPALLCYDKTKTIIPCDVVIGADTNQVNQFFERCLTRSRMAS